MEFGLQALSSIGEGLSIIKIERAWGTLSDWINEYLKLNRIFEWFENAQLIAFDLDRKYFSRSDINALLVLPNSSVDEAVHSIDKGFIMPEVPVSLRREVSRNLV